MQQMAAGDPEACFKEAELRDADFRTRESANVARPPTRMIVAIDASGSMAGRVGEERKLDLAKKAAAAFVDKVPSEVEAGLLVFGQAGNNTQAGKSASCQAVDLATPLTSDRDRLGKAVAAVRPVGWTPLAAALTRAEALLSAGAARGEQVIYVVSDGEETCGGDPVAVARSINQGQTKAVVNIIGFAVPDREAAALDAVAAAGGGTFVNNNSVNQVDAAMARIRENNRQALNSIAHRNATSLNNISTRNAGALTRICTRNLAAREQIALKNDIARKRLAGKSTDIEEQAQRLMEQRHAALKKRTDAYVSQLDAARDQVNQRVDQDARGAR